MFIYDTYVNTENGNNSGIVTIKEFKNGKATAVFIDFDSKDPIDRNGGICIEINPQMVITEYMADYRCSPWWSKPYFGKDTADIPNETQALLIKDADGKFCVVIPVVNDEYKCILSGITDNKILATVFSMCDGLNSCKGLVFVYAYGDNPFELIEKCVKTALNLLKNGTKYIKERKYPDIFNYLGWCSWDGMQIRVAEDLLLEKCSEFKSKNIPVKWIMIDDMWSEIRDFYGKKYSNFKEMLMLMHSSTLYHFKADPYRFPNGLKECINKINSYNMKVGMWFPVTGYWGGINPHGEAYEILKDYLISDKEGRYIPDWHMEKSYAYFNTINNYLKESGAEFIKIDEQSLIPTCYENQAPIGQIAREYHKGMEISAEEKFENCMINCMGMGIEDMWNRSDSPLSRCSDDFKPENEEWFISHVLQCTYNTLIQGQFYWCDWDMWWTDDNQALKNSLVRAISGGPVYISDKQGRSKKEVLMPLVLENGRILRCDRPGMPTVDCITSDSTVNRCALKLQNIAGEYGIMLVLNIDEGRRNVKAKISGDLIPGFVSDEYVVYEHFTQKIKIMKKGEKFEETLKNFNDYRLYIFAPIHNGFAAIGRSDKFISPKTIKYTRGEHIELVENGPYAYIKYGKLYNVL